MPASKHKARIVCIGSDGAELDILREYSDLLDVDLHWQTNMVSGLRHANQVAANLVVLLYTDFCSGAARSKCAFDWLPEFTGEGLVLVTGRDMPAPVVSAAVDAGVLVLPWEELLVSTFDHLLYGRSLERYAGF